MTVLLIILAVLAVILLLPIRVKGGYGGGNWHIAAYYACFRVFHKESKEKPPVLHPPKPDEEITAGQLTEVLPVDSVSAQNAAAVQHIETEQEESEPPQPEPVHEESPAEPSAETVTDTPPVDEIPEEKPEKPKKMTYFRWIKPHSLPEILALVQDGCAALSPGVRSLTKHLRFRHVNLRLNVATDDPMKTARTYGAICGAFYNLHAQLCCVFDIEADSLRILADFEHEKFDFEGSMEIRVSPAALILIALVVGIKFLSVNYPRYRREKKEKLLTEQETSPIPAE